MSQGSSKTERVEPFIRVNDSNEVKKIKLEILRGQNRINELEKGLKNITRLHAQLKRDFEQYKRVKQY